ncbi:hypothetical protein O185_11130 [Photorhabdus temperata J3]|uniref:Uncharacterized protein n=1 Tax=Photorhabdus temperata J3 TaxID=1389415 RepID=U7QY96_PHOTE|nr:hypothetical protein O185_11130 [Photorhabdus temperata J3]
MVMLPESMYWRDFPLNLKPLGFRSGRSILIVDDDRIVVRRINRVTATAQNPTNSKGTFGILAAKGICGAIEAAGDIQAL